MRFGVCGGLPAGEAGYESLRGLAEIGFAYLELPLAQVADLSEADFRVLEEGLDRAGLPCEALNVFFPRRIRLTGPEADLAKMEAYVREALGRARRLGAQVVVLGSSGSRNVPEGFSRARAWKQLVEAGRRIDPLAEEAGVTVAVEPLNRKESNILNTLEEALDFVQQVDRPHIQALVDYYHFTLEQEPLKHVIQAGNLLRHAHFAQMEGRAYPTVMQEGYRPFFTALKAAGYAGRMSIEAGTSDLLNDARQALAVLREAAG